MQTQSTVLFSGRPEPFGGLSNEDELVKACPDKFKGDNAWSNYAMQLFYKGGNIANWKWKTEDKTERHRQLGCFRGLLGTFGIKHEHKEAVAGWMLSEMLSEIPEYVPGEKN